MVHRFPILWLSILAVVVAACSGIVEQSESAPPALELRVDGLGPYRIGDPFDLVVDGVAADLGGWDADSADPPSQVLVPDCGGPTRLVSWGNLILLFVGEAGSETFFTWSYGFDPVTGNANDLRALGLTTAEGVGLGDPLDVLEAAYGDDITVAFDQAADLTTFTIDADAAEHLAGRFDGHPPEGVVQLIERVPSCSSPASG